jgi:hypothetical protein
MNIIIQAVEVGVVILGLCFTQAVIQQWLCSRPAARKRYLIALDQWIGGWRKERPRAQDFIIAVGLLFSVCFASSAFADGTSTYKVNGQTFTNQADADAAINKGLLADGLHVYRVNGEAFTKEADAKAEWIASANRRGAIAVIDGQRYVNGQILSESDQSARESELSQARQGIIDLAEQHKRAIHDATELATAGLNPALPGVKEAWKRSADVQDQTDKDLVAWAANGYPISGPKATLFGTPVGLNVGFSGFSQPTPTPTVKATSSSTAKVTTVAAKTTTAPAVYGTPKALVSYGVGAKS